MEISTIGSYFNIATVRGTTDVIRQYQQFPTFNTGVSEQLLPHWSQIRTINSVNGNLNNGSYFNIAQYEACVNGTYLPVCRQNIQGEASRVLCRSNGNDDSMFSTLSTKQSCLATECLLITLSYDCSVFWMCVHTLAL